MSIRTIMTLCLSVAVTGILAAQSSGPAKPGPELQRLGAFVGKWSSEGQAQASPYGPAGKVTSVETFEWLPGGFFMEHRWDVRQGGKEIKGVEILGYDRAAKVYTSRFFDNLGSSGSIKATVSGNTWTWTAESEVDGKPLKERGTWTVANDTITTKWEFSTDGSTWKPNFEAKITRTK